VKIVHKASEFRDHLWGVQKQGFAVGFVPTMGALHEGHLSLIRRSKAENAVTVVSVFVNPTQFGPNEDFDRYPRDLERDAKLALSEKADFLYAPESPEIYRSGFSTYIEETALSRVLCGAHRPGHFRGVLTVVFRLFNLVRPDRAYFGRKDAQQLRLIEKMAEDLGLDVEIAACPTVRDPDGLAMSSRNAYLVEEERAVAPRIYGALRAAEAAFDAGERRSDRLVDLARAVLAACPSFSVQYLELRTWRDLAEADVVSERSVLAVAGVLGKTRLIDNVILDPTR
jgi:pantoate--beta-alanine ligase